MLRFIGTVPTKNEVMFIAVQKESEWLFVCVGWQPVEDVPWL